MAPGAGFEPYSIAAIFSHSPKSHDSLRTHHVRPSINFVAPQGVEPCTPRIASRVYLSILTCNATITPGAKTSYIETHYIISPAWTTNARSCEIMNFNITSLLYWNTLQYHGSTILRRVCLCNEFQYNFSLRSASQQGGLLSLCSKIAHGVVSARKCILVNF